MILLENSDLMVSFFKISSPDLFKLQVVINHNLDLFQPTLKRAETVVSKVSYPQKNKTSG